jgi:hypothetical protein
MTNKQKAERIVLALYVLVVIVAVVILLTTGTTLLHAWGIIDISGDCT